MRPGPPLPVATPADLADIAGLFRAYAASLDVDLAYQGFEAELACLPGRYGAPGGALLLSRLPDGGPAGCVALRPILPEGTCEMKRLYVAPEARGTGLGAALVEAAVGAAERLDHREMRLDTLPGMRAAIGLYRRLGFEPGPPYGEAALPGTLFLRRRLNPGRAPGGGC